MNIIGQNVVGENVGLKVGISDGILVGALEGETLGFVGAKLGATDGD